MTELWVINEAPGRPDPAVIEALARVDTTQLADSGPPVAVLAPGLRRLAGRGGFCGPAVTVWTEPGDILYVLKAVDSIGPGDVLLVDGGGREDGAVIGDIGGGALAGRGGLGMVVDGAVRDLDGLDELGLPVFARAAYPATGSNRGPGAINVPVRCGGVTVRPGDVVRADSSGVVVVPRAALAEVAARAAAVAEKEAGWRAVVAAGRSFPAATGIDALIAELAPPR